MTDLQLAVTHVQLSTEWKKPQKNLALVGELIDSLKTMFLKMTFMPTPIDTKAREDALAIQRDVLEIAVMYAIEKKDIPAFERAIAQIKHYYNELQWAEEELPHKYMLLGLNLMCLLSRNRLAEFHTELEGLPQKVVEGNIYISHPVKLEQYLMEGTYHKIFVSKENVPAPYYNFFMDILINTVRNEIGTCMDKVYDSLTIAETARMLFFNDPVTMQADVLSYAKKRNWEMASDKSGFLFLSRSKNKKVDSHLPAEILAKNNIFYAKQLEMIV